MNKCLYFIALLLLGTIFFSAAHAGSPTQSPSIGSQLRKDILGVVRVRIEAEAGVKVKLIVKKISAKGNKAHLCVLPVNVDGSQLDMKKTILADVYEGMKNGEMDGIETGLEGSASSLVKSNGQWFEVAWSGGPSVCSK